MYQEMRKRFAIGLLSFLLALVPTAYLAAQKDAGYNFYREGRTAMQSREYARAIESFDKAINAASNNYRYYFMKGVAQMKLKKWDDAISTFQSGSKYNTTFASFDVNIANCYIKREPPQYQQAIAAYEAAFNKEGDVAKKTKYKTIIAKLYVRSNNNDAALRALTEAEALPGASTDINLMFTKGDVYGKMNKWSEALSYFQKALQRAQAINLPVTQQAQYKYGVGLAYCKNNQNAEYQNIYKELQSSSAQWAGRLKRACEGSSGSITKDVRLASGYMKAGFYDEALDKINKAIQNPPADKAGAAITYRVAATIHYKMGQSSQAAKYFAMAAQSEPDATKASKIYQTLIKLQISNKMYQDALTTADKILEKKNNDVKIWFLKAQAQYKLSRYNEAIFSAEKCISLSGGTAPSPATAPYYFLIGMAARKAGNANKAMEAFTSASKVKGAIGAVAKEEMTSGGAK